MSVNHEHETRARTVNMNRVSHVPRTHVAFGFRTANEGERETGNGKRDCTSGPTEAESTEAESDICASTFPVYFSHSRFHSFTFRGGTELYFRVFRRRATVVSSAYYCFRVHEWRL